MNIRDYLIDSEKKDWRKLLGYWRPLIPDEATLWFVNKLGDAFFSGRDGAIHCLIVGTGSFEKVAPDKEAFAKSLDNAERANQWLRISLIEGCRRAGLQLGVDECYAFKVPPPLLGQYEVSNLQPGNIYSHYSWLAYLTRQEEIYWTGD